MRKILIFIFAHLVFLQFTTAQNELKAIDRLKVFIDCSSTWCDMSFIRTEINIVDFMLDRTASDVHLLITSQNTGSGGDRYQIILFGQNRFKNLQDTVYFNTGPNQTGFEIRDILVKYLKLGLAPFVAKTEAAKDVTISFKRAETDKKILPLKQKRIPGVTGYSGLGSMATLMLMLYIRKTVSAEIFQPTGLQKI
ncbi:MAG TPA: hypothetical protein VN451_08450 [Chitinophagaceae bacterium]|nr:hypothetical protein [Chitinophagaceae bacterium]